MNNEKVNIVFCSSELNPEDIQALDSQNSPLVLISTDWFYPNERQQFKVFFKNVSFYCFNDFLKDSDLENCDNLVREKYIEFEGQENYFGKFVEGIKYFKCKLLVESLSGLFNRFSLYYHPTRLGLSSEYFKTIKCTNVNDLKLSSYERYTRLKHQIKINLLSILHPYDVQKNIEIHNPQKPSVLLIKVDIFEYNDIGFVILGGLKRLKNKLGKLLYSDEIDLIKWKVFFNTILPEINCDKVYFGVEGHSFKYEYAYVLPKLSLIADGYWPPNYTYSYHGIYPENVDFACLSETDVLFCENIGIKYTLNFRFLFSPLVLNESNSLKIDTKKETQTVVLLSQCTSEWTSLINRSDAGRLIEAFANLAQLLPDTNFIIRPHPGMTLSVHDGEKSIARIKSFVENLNLKNLHVSEQTITEDFNKGDVFITEYSTAAFESMALGKVWISCNLTKRRNYFQYFEEMGFLNANSESELFTLVQSVLKGDEARLRKFNSAQKRYKALF